MPGFRSWVASATPTAPFARQVPVRVSWFIKICCRLDSIANHVIVQCHDLDAGRQPFKYLMGYREGQIRIETGRELQFDPKAVDSPGINQQMRRA